MEKIIEKLAKKIFEIFVLATLQPSTLQQKLPPPVLKIVAV